MVEGSGAVVGQMRVLWTLGTPGGMDDSELLEVYVARGGGDWETAFAQLVERHGPMVLRVCRDVLGDAHAAQDAFQTTFLVLAQRAAWVSRTQSVGNWLYGVAHRTALKARTAEARRRRRETRVAEAGRRDPEDGPEHPHLDLLHEELKRLPDRLRSPIVLHHLQGMSYSAVGGRLGLTESTVRGRLARARAILRQRLARRGVTLAAGAATGLFRQRCSAAPAELVRAAVRGAVAAQGRWAKVPGLAPAATLLLARGGIPAMLAARLQVVVCLVLAVGLGVLANVVRLVAREDPPAGSHERVVVAAGQTPSQPDPAASAGREVKQRKTGGQPTVDERLARAVDGRIVGTLPITRDCMVLSYLPDWDHGDVDNLGIANNDGGVRTLLRWKAVSADELRPPGRRFVLALYSRKTTAGTSVGPMLAFDLAADWPERTSWKRMPNYAAEPAARYAFRPGEGWKLFDVTSQVRSQAVAGGGRFGVLLRWLSEDRSGPRQNWSGYQLVSREATGEWESRRPVLLLVDPARD